MQHIQNNLSLRDLSDPSAGPHAMQEIVHQITRSLEKAWSVEKRAARGTRLVSSDDNYNTLGYPSDAVARNHRYTRWMSESTLLRTHTTAIIPPELRRLAEEDPPDALIVAPGITYRRDVIDRTHVGEPHQLDLWRISQKELTQEDLLEMIACVIESILPGCEWRSNSTSHHYTTDGLEIEVKCEGEWLELLECGMAHGDLLKRCGLTHHTGLAMGIGLDRALMLVKGICDIRLLRSADERVASQMLDLSPYRQVSSQPPLKRDVSVVCSPMSAEDVAEVVREALGDRSEWVEEVRILAHTPHHDLPSHVQERLGTTQGKENLLVRVILRHPTIALSKKEAHSLTQQILSALNSR